MALGNSTNKVYLSVADGKIVQRAQSETAGAQPRTKKDGTIVYELKYAFVTGILTGISVRTGQFSGQEIKEWVFDMVDGKEAYQVQMMFDSRYATSLLFSLANPEVDFSKPITITPWMKIINDKKKTACYLKQGEKSIDWYFTKDNPHGLPDLVSVKFKGKETWDSFDRMQFLEKYVEENIKPKLNHDTHAAPPVLDYADSLLGSEPEEDDLPF